MRKKRLIKSCIITIFICLFISVLPLLLVFISDESSSDFAYNNFNVTATVNRDGSLSMREEFNLEAEGRHTYIREILYSKDGRANYASYNQGEFDASSFKVTVESEDKTISATPLENDYRFNYNTSSDIIAFTGETNELGDRVVCSESNCAKVEIYLAEGIKSSTKYILEYKINNAVNVFNDVAELNWKLIPALEAVKKNVKLTLNLPDNNFVLGEDATNGDIHYYGYGGVNSNFVKDECSNKQIVAESKKLASNEEMEILCYFPSEMISTTSTTNVFDRDGEEEILKRVQENLDLENQYVFMKNLTLILNLVCSIIFILVMIFVYYHVYKKYDKELVSSFEAEYYRELPADYGPAVMGYLYHEEIVTADDLNATLMDLIRRKYISIDTNGSNLIDKKPNYKLIYDREKDQSSLVEHEKYLLYWYFDVIGQGQNEITLNDIDKFVSVEKNAREYNKCNDEWNKQVLVASQKRHFFDTFANQGTKYNFICFFGIVIAISCTYSMITRGNTILWIFAFISLVLSCCFIVYTKQIKRRSKEGNEDFVRWRAFEKFLKDFSRFEDYPIPGIVVWEHYLVYATSFGIADLVEKQLRTKFKELNRMDEFNGSVFYYPYVYNYMGHRINSTRNLGRQTIATAEAKRMASSSRSGGHGGFGGGSSFGGGGGHSSVR